MDTSQGELVLFYINKMKRIRVNYSISLLTTFEKKIIFKSKFHELLGECSMDGCHM